MSFTYRAHYFDDPLATASFEECANAVFGLSFDLWKEKGLWPDTYTAFSAFDGDKCVSSMAVYPCEMMIEGQAYTAAELLTVGTLKAYRGQGLQRRIWERARAWIEPQFDFTFLFTDYTAGGFYEKIGFRRQTEFTRLLQLPRASEPGKSSKPDPNLARRLDLSVEADYRLLHDLIHGRSMVSHRFGSRNPKLLLFMFLYLLGQVTWYLQELDCIIVCVKTDQHLQIYDIIATEMPTIEMLEPFLGHFGKSLVEFKFCPDLLRLSETQTAEMDLLGVVCNDLYVTDNIELPWDTIFPASLRV